MATLVDNMVEEIKSKIDSGIYVPGDKIDSLNELCRNYNVSKITAIRAVAHLAKLGVIKKIQGRGSFVSGNSKKVQECGENISEIDTIVIITIPDIILSHYEFERKMCLGICERAKELGLEVRFQEPKIDLLGESMSNWEKNEAGIIFFGRDNDGKASHFFATGNPRGVVVDSFAPGVHCVLTDNAFGMRGIINELAKRSCRRLLYAPHFSLRKCNFNVSERLESFITETTQAGMDWEIQDGCNYEIFHEKLQSSKPPDAILFPCDDPAINCAEFLEERGVKIHNDVIICGFDGFSPSGKDYTRLLTAKVNPEKIGKTAVDVIASGQINEPVPIWKRIKPEVIVPWNSSR